MKFVFCFITTWTVVMLLLLTAVIIIHLNPILMEPFGLILSYILCSVIGIMLIFVIVKAAIHYNRQRKFNS